MTCSSHIMISTTEDYPIMSSRTQFNSHTKPTLSLCNQDPTENPVWPGSAPACSKVVFQTMKLCFKTLPQSCFFLLLLLLIYFWGYNQILKKMLYTVIQTFNFCFESIALSNCFEFSSLGAFVFFWALQGFFLRKGSGSKTFWDLLM